MLRRGVVDVLRTYKHQWWRLVLLQTLVLLGLSAVIGAIALFVQGGGAGLMAYISADLDQLESRAVGVASVLIAVIVLVSIPFLVAGAAATARVTDTALAGGRPRLWRALGRGFARFVPVLGALVLGFLLILVFLVATPFISLVGVLGLAVTGVIALLRRRWPALVATWPSWRAWGFAAIPFAWFGRVAATAVLMFPAAVLEPTGPILAYRVAEKAAAGRRLPILAVSAVAFVAAVALSAGSTLLGSALWGEFGASLLGGIVQLVAVPIPIVAAVALYRRAAGPSGRVLQRAAPAPSRVASSASPVMTRIAVATVAALVATTAVVVPVVGVASPAAADPAGQDVVFVVSSAVDTLDTGALATQQTSCRTSGPDCTLRAALAVAAEDAAGGAASATIGFAGSMTITLAGPLSFAPIAPTAGVLTIDGSGSDVVLDGGNSYQILSVTSEQWNLRISEVTFRHGYSSGFGGAIVAGVPQTTLTSVLFDGNAAGAGGGAVFARALTVLGSTFLNSRATSWTGSTYGGAIRTTGAVSILNSTFSGSGIGDSFTPVLNNGSDVASDAGMTVVNSTFVNSQGGSLRASGPSEIRNSLFTTDWTRGGLICSGPFFGGQNLSREGDTTCPGTLGSTSVTVVGALDSSGVVPVYPLNPSGNPALGAGTNCPATDALGAARALNGCDLGAVEFSGLTTVALATEPSATVAGTVTLRATVTSDTGAVPQGSVTFSFDGVPYGPIALSSAVAEVEVPGLTMGQTYAYSAAFTPTGPFEPSSAGPLDYTVQPVQVAVDLLCANPTEPECLGTWNIADSESIHLVAKVIDDRAGTVSVAIGSTVIAGPVAIVSGEAAFVIPASAFGPGLQTDLHAIYQSDDGNHAGLSPARSLVVLLTPTVTISGAATSGIYGDPTDGTFTVTVTGAGAIPTGTVTVFGRTATLDASGMATLDLSDIPVGAALALKAQYSGDGVYGRGVSGTAHYETTPAATTTEIGTISPAAPRFGEAITVTVTVKAVAPSGRDPQGSVTLVVDGSQNFGPIAFDPYAQNADGTMTFDVVIPADALGTGDHELVAEFTGNDNFTASTSPSASLSVGAAATTTALIATPTPSIFGDQVTLTATVDATGVGSVPTGSITFTAGATTLGSAALSACDLPNPDGCAVASITVAASAIGIGTTTLAAGYQGASNFDPSSGAIAGYTVSKATPTVSVSGTGSLVYGQSSTYTVAVGSASVAPVDGTQITVTAVPTAGDPVLLGVATLSAGSATVVVPTLGTLAPGAYQVIATFAGDASFETATGSTALTVNAATTNIDLDSISSTTVVYGNSIDVALTVDNTSTDRQPEGDVVVTWAGHEVGRATLTAADDNGTGTRTVHIAAVFGTNVPGPGEFWLTAEFVPAIGFSGDQLNSDAHEERQKVTITPMPTEVSLQGVTAVIGQPLTATAHVDIVGEDLGIVPGGAITFLITKSGAGTQTVGPITLVNGQVTLADALGASPIIVGLAGTWTVRATYSKDTDSRYFSASPTNTAIQYIDVDASSASVTAVAPATAEYGAPVLVHAIVAGAVTPTGLVRVQLSGFGNVLASAEVPLVNGQADIAVDPAWLAIGPHEFVVYYSGDGTLNSASSAPFTITVGKTGTTTTVSTSSQVLTLYPGIVGSQVQYSAHVTASVGTPAGFVNFSRGAISLGQAPLDIHGNAGISVTADEDWSGNIVAEFVSTDGLVAGSQGTLAHSWIHAPVVVTVQGPTSSKIGVATEYTVGVRFDWDQFQYLGTSLRPQQAPSGLVTIGDGNGTSCTATLIDDGNGAPSSHGTCQIQFGHLGAHAFTATFGGNSTYAVGSSAVTTTTVAKGVPALTLATPDGDYWRGLTTIPVDWSVVGPTDGTVTIKLGAATVCTSSSLVGSCDVAIPAYAATNGNRLTLEYSGNPLWNPGTASHTGTVVACIPYQQSTSNPAGTATVTLSPAPTCGGGTGYYTTDLVTVVATPEDGYKVIGLSGGLAAGSTVRWPYLPSEANLASNGSASMLTSPTLGWSGSQQIPFGIQANTQAACVVVRFQTTGIANRSDALNAIFWDAPNTCGSPTISGNSVIQSIPNGAQVRVTYQPGFMPDRTKFYGWQGLASGDRFAERATYTVGPDTRTITAAFGPVCYNNGPNVMQPDQGTITVSLPAPNCSDPQTGTTGWTYGTAGTATLVDAVATTYQVVSSRYASLNGHIQLIEDKAWLPERPVYFDGWRGDTGSWTEGATTTDTSGGVQRASRTISFRLGERPFTISAAYGGCSTLSTQVNGDASDGPPGTITVNTPGNCPVGAGVGATRWYKTGTQVSVTTAASGKTLRFLGWSGFSLGSARLLDSTVTFALNSNTTATASYGTNANCRPLTVSTVPAGALTLDTSFSLGPNACAAMYGSKFYDQGTGGNGISIDATPATADANGAETVFAWATNEPGSASGSEGGRSSLWKRTPSLNEFFYGVSTVIAYSCEFVAIGANVYSPDGQLVNTAGAVNISRDSQSRLADFLITQPADCSTGADPRSGYGGYAWVVGTQLVPVVSADPVAYRFTGWSGDVKGTGETPDTPLSLVGPGRTAQGDNYHYRVTANFEAICYTLSLPSDADKLEVITAPNCPGVDASRRMYLGGTAVVVHAPDKGDTLFRNWVSGVDVVDADTHWASVVMTSDKSVVPYYSSKSAGEQITTYGTMVGESLAIASKKMIGVVSVAVSTYFKTIISKATLVASGIGYIAQGLEYFGVEGAVIDGMKNASTAMNDMISLLFAPLDCITAWSAGGQDTAFYAAQNLIGAAIVTSLSASAQKPQTATAETTFQKLQAQAAAAKEQAQPAAQGLSAILAAKSIYDAAATGNIGWESSAYDAWASQSSVSIYTTCMANTAGAAATSVMTVGQ